MDTGEIRRRLRTDFFQMLDDPRQEDLAEGKVRPKLRKMLQALRKRGVDLSPEEEESIIESVRSDLTAYGPLQMLLDDVTITEIMVNGPKRVFVERNGRKILSNARFDDERHLRRIIAKLMQGSQKRLDESSPWVDLALPDGSRVNIVIPPAVSGGSHLTIRKHMTHIATIDDLIRLGTLNKAIAAFLIACVRSGVTILLSGASGTGKTTLMEVLATYIRQDERLVIIEDTPEIKVGQENVVRLLTRAANVEGRGAITTRQLFTNCLRMRPNRIILGELRGSEAFDYLQAATSGHRGSLGVIHSASPEEALLRLENLFMQAGVSVPVRAIRSQMVHAIDLVIQLTQHDDGVRRVTRVSEVIGIDGDGEVTVSDVFHFRESDHGGARGARGAFQATGSVPTCYSRFRSAGVELDRRIFQS